MRPVVATIAVVLVAIAALSQIFIPGIVAGSVEERLEERGGSAEVSVSAIPAVRLLWASGSGFEASGENLEIDLRDRTDDPLKRLDGFDEVDIRFEGLQAGAVAVDTFALSRGEDDDTYYLRLAATTDPEALAESAGERAGGALGGLVGSLAKEFLPGDESLPIPIEVEGEVDRGIAGRVDVDDVDASVGGLPAGPFAELLVQAVLDRL